MTFAALETSVHEGSPIELYLFQTDDLLFSWGYTTGNEPYSFAGLAYQPEAISRGELKQNAAETGSDRLTVNVPWDNPVAVLHVPYLPPRPVRLTIYRVQRRDTTLEVVQGFTGYISGFGQRGTQAEFACSQIIDSMQQSVPWAVYKSGCIWTTYEVGCGKNREDFLTTISDISAIVGKSVFSATAASKASGWFSAGIAENPATGEVRFIKEHIGNELKLNYPFIGLTTAATLKLYAGDDHQPETCRLKFNNKVNYVGFDFFPNYNVFKQGTK